MKDLKNLFGTDGIRGVAETKTMDMVNEAIGELSKVIEECDSNLI